jgi:hypothetical protein
LPKNPRLTQYIRGFSPILKFPGINMNNRSLFFTFAALVIVICTLGSGSVAAQPKVSADEQKMAQAIKAAPDAAGKATAAAEFVKKYPKSPLRPVIAEELADQIREITNADQKIALAQQFKSVFNSPAEEEMILPVLIVGYADAKKPDDAFSAGGTYLTQHPDSVSVLIELTMLATEQAKQRNGKFITPGEQYGAHAIELIEGNKKPAEMPDATWTEYKALLPRLYQSMGILGMVRGDRAVTLTRLTKASELDPKDPFNYLLISGSLNDDYQEAARHYQSMPDGAPKTAELPKVLAALDRVIDSYAHFVALSEGNAQLGTIRQQELQDLEKYYKYRHDGKTDGMQQLIDKYKNPAKPKDPLSLP